MQKNIIYLVIFVLVSCSKTNPEEYIKHINGYWGIEKVITLEGDEKLYNFSQSVDFFEVKELNGIRKKVRPQIDGSFLITKDSKTFTLSIENDSLRMYYKTPFASWKETLISAKENEMIIRNKNGNLYFYKRYTKIDL